MRVVTPYRPFPPESAHHQRLGAFDWIEAIRMLSASVARSCHCATLAITGPEDDLPVPAIQLPTTQSRLMLWMLDVARAYVSSDAFDEDTVMICPDLLVFQDLRPWFHADLGLVIRSQEKFHAADKRLLNAVQFWRVAAKPGLIQFFERALAIGRSLPEPVLRWGADTEALRHLIEPIPIDPVLNLQPRAGLTVAMLPAHLLLHELTSREMFWLQQTMLLPPPRIPIVDFKAGYRKPYMRAFYEATIGSAVLA
jgi:hypothetical protein